MKKLPISVTIITLNESGRIGDAIRSVKEWVDEVIVVDSGSNDDTVCTCKSLGATVFYNKWPGYGEQKRYAEELSSNDWILNIDADERISTELMKEIYSIFMNERELADAYYIPIHDIIYPTSRVSKSTPYYPVRLYRKSKGRYSESPVHDRVIMNIKSNTLNLEGKILHHPIKNYTHRVEKMNKYSSAQVDDMQTKGRKASVTRIFLEFPISFIKRYIFKHYWREGVAGFIYSMNYAYSRFLRQIKLYEREKNKKTNSLQGP